MRTYEQKLWGMAKQLNDRLKEEKDLKHHRKLIYLQLVNAFNNGASEFEYTFETTQKPYARPDIVLKK